MNLVVYTRGGIIRFVSHTPSVITRQRVWYMTCTCKTRPTSATCLHCFITYCSHMLTFHIKRKMRHKHGASRHAVFYTDIRMSNKDTCTPPVRTRTACCVQEDYEYRRKGSTSENERLTLRLHRICGFVQIRVTEAS